MTHALLAELAGPADDEAIRGLLADSPIPGRVELVTDRAPDYFLSCGVMGRDYLVGIVREATSGGIVGLGYRGLQERFVNGAVESIGYLSDVVVARPYQRSWVYPRLLRLLHELHGDGRARGYVFVVAGQHDVLLDNLLPTVSRSFLPRVTELTGLWTLALVARRRQAGPSPDDTARRGSSAELGEIVDFLQREGRRRQLFPSYSEADFAPGAPLTLGFRAEDFFLAYRAGRLVGVLGLWDRSGFKRTVVRGYGRGLGWLRPGYDLGARLLGARPLPAPGEPVGCVYAAFTCVADDDPGVYSGLLGAARAEAARRGHAYLMVGLTDGDPLLPVARRFAHLPYRSRVYTVSYPGEPDLHERLDGRAAYLELAAT